MTRKLGKASGFAASISFSLLGLNDQKQMIVPGTGFRIAPGLALTAAHVANELFTKLVLREGMPFPRQQGRYEGVEVRAVEPDPGGLMGELAPWWYVDGFFNSRLTDISLLIISAGNDAARRAEEHGTFLRWNLSPPSLEQRLYAFGYILPTTDLHIHKQTDSLTDFEAHYTVDTQRVIVKAVHERGRRESPLDVPAILGGPRGLDPYSAPSFEVIGEISASMSGGPAFNSDLLYGVTSLGLTERGDDNVDRDVAGLMMLLKPLLEMPEVSLGNSHPPIKLSDLIDSGKIRSLP